MPNTGKTYILGNSKSLAELDGTFVEIPTLNINEEVKIHNWIVQLFRKNTIEKVVIEIDNNPNLSLQIGYHIRLSIEDLQSKTLLPILYVSNLSLNSLILQAEINSHIFATKGVYFSEWDFQSVKQEVEHLIGLNESEYLTSFLKIIHIQPDETVGRHSLANLWGAYAMDKAANTNALSTTADFKKKLYFKYVSAFNNIYKLKASPLKVLGNINIGSANKIKAEGKRILLIDDEADSGWETVLRKVFKTTNVEDFVVINEKVKDFDTLTESSKSIIKAEKFDLYLVDLRLNGLEEDDSLKTKEFSGMKLLRKIKSFNEGNQVIIFSASNKVWNLKALLEAGADGYYMKESPEFNFSRKISEQKYDDFKFNVERCFKRSYLRELFVEWGNALNQSNNHDASFIAESTTSLNMAWEQLKSNYLDFGFLTLYQSIESFANKLYLLDDDNDTLEGTTTIEKIDSNQSKWLMTFVKDNQNGDFFSSGEFMQQSNIKPTTLYKVSCLFKIKYHKDDNFLKKIGSLNAKRNRIAHDGARGFATKNDLKEILKILTEVRSN